MAEVPLSETPGRISGIAEHFRDRRLRGAQAPVLMRVQDAREAHPAWITSRQQRRPRRCADEAAT